MVLSFCKKKKKSFILTWHQPNGETATKNVSGAENLELNPKAGQNNSPSRDIFRTLRRPGPVTSNCIQPL